MARLMIAYNSEELKALGLGILLEAKNRASTGKAKRIIAAAGFTDSEKALIRTYYNHAWQWEMVKGYPQEHVMTYSTYQLLQRAVGVYASIW